MVPWVLNVELYLGIKTLFYAIEMTISGPVPILALYFSSSYFGVLSLSLARNDPSYRVLILPSLALIKSTPMVTPMTLLHDSLLRYTDSPAALFPGPFSPDFAFDSDDLENKPTNTSSSPGK
jgi:hypothetical protein